MLLDLSKVSEWSAYFKRVQSQDAGAIAQLHATARGFLEHFRWCTEVTEEYVGFAYPGIFAVFLFRIRPAREGVDEWVWIVVGDLPPAYITCEESPNPATAVDSYIGAMQEWVEAVSKGEPIDGLIPVNVPATKENAEQLRIRLKFLDDNILVNYGEDLKAR